MRRVAGEAGARGGDEGADAGESRVGISRGIENEGESEAVKEEKKRVESEGREDEEGERGWVAEEEEG